MKFRKEDFEKKCIDSYIHLLWIDVVGGLGTWYPEIPDNEEEAKLMAKELKKKGYRVKIVKMRVC